ncbi:hypothetical protein EDI_291330 [Entamoeba dispar SAW760]|uniref:BRCT domain-containing protein n=1 Tax=Entamoeba dispar (strain ATCC PRA-260 / SAW760) TaxID=370354 RepID=B0EPI2_ENTDS|nr:uncharacterized protein EDI_291330 [Entamoeba dispar SAW760]EDR23559.1 hypothetical protein EDI_291330 [Entamoeba dispar SAW760]|eukprot:EDR23559.1 hypothetical protein EDI_291330 [Entamoeba dispar SAW760]
MQVDMIEKPIQFLDGNVICTSGFNKDERKMLKEMIESCGGFYLDELDSSIVTCLILKGLFSKKAQCAKQSGIPVISFQWIFDCISERRLFSFNNYLIN